MPIFEDDTPELPPVPKGWAVAETEPEDEDNTPATKCRTPECFGDPDDGEGWDGYCGNCADREQALADSTEACDECGGVPPAPGSLWECPDCCADEDDEDKQALVDEFADDPDRHLTEAGIRSTYVRPAEPSDEVEATEVPSKEELAPQPRSKRKGYGIDEDVPSQGAPPKRKKRAAWAVEDFEDDEPDTQKLVHDREQAIRSRVVDEDEPVLKPRLTVGPKGEPVVHLDDEKPRTMKVHVVQETDGEITQDEVIGGEPIEAVVAKMAEKSEPVVPVTRLSERAMLVSLNISQWGGRRFDKAVSDETNARKGAGDKAGRFNKVLLPECAELAEVHRLTSSMRNWFVAQTMPWMNDGARIMPSAKYLAFNAEFNARRATWQRAVDALVGAYPALVTAAQRKLGAMYDRTDYVSQFELATKFSMAVRVLPLPDKADFRVDLDDKTMATIKEAMADNEADLAKTMVVECWQRLHKVVEAMAERLANPETVFRDSLIENLDEVVDVLKDLNITGDKVLEAVRLDVAATLGKYTAADLRLNRKHRAAAATKAKAVAEDIASRMGALMGGA